MNFKEMKGKDWWKSLSEDEAHRKSYDKIWEATGRYKNSYQPDVEAGLMSLKSKIAADKTASAKIIRLSPMQRIMRIAAVFIAILAVGFLMTQFYGSNSNLAILESGNNKIEAYELPDGSKIWLNKNSELQFPKAFSPNERRVTLKGEGFFEITKNPNAPFIVETPNSEVRVLGTSFNVRCIKGENFDEVQVETGKVNFAPKTEDKAFDLIKNERAVFNLTDKSITKDKDLNLNALAWKNKHLNFENTPLLEVFEQLGRYYKVDFDTENLSIQNCPFSAQYSTEKIEEILPVLNTAFNLEIETISAIKIKILGGDCPN